MTKRKSRRWRAGKQPRSRKRAKKTWLYLGWLDQQDPVHIGIQAYIGLKTTSGKNSRNFHTLGYEMGNLQKLVFLHTQKVLFHTLENNFIPWSLFHTLKTFFIPWNNNFIPFLVCFIAWKLFSYLYTTISYLVKFFLLYTVLSFHTKHQHFVSLSWYFIPSGQKTAHLSMKWRPRVWNKSMTVWKIWQMLWKYDMTIIVIWVCFVHCQW